ncbi:Hypothetical Protein XCAW_03049 [Xanthomonas citri subsp. citri Aw12879]|nr:Hypothetical Protein XCAW_03049 [Xanthomonas citri subsp. citri Aw12879]
MRLLAPLTKLPVDAFRATQAGASIDNRGDHAQPASHATSPFLMTQS